MKKVLSLLAIFAVMFLLVACDNNKNDIENNELPNNQDIVENGENFVENGEEEKFYSVDEVNNYAIFQFIRLEENPTTGYGWQYTVADENIAVVEDDEYVQNQVPEGWTGVGGEHTYRLSGISSGETTITFKYVRPWETDKAPEKEITFNLKVNENNEVLVVGEE